MLVDQLELGGKRYVVLCRDQRSITKVDALTKRERECVSYAALNYGAHNGNTYTSYLAATVSARRVDSRGIKIPQEAGVGPRVGLIAT